MSAEITAGQVIAVLLIISWGIALVSAYLEGREERAADL